VNYTKATNKISKLTTQDETAKFLKQGMRLGATLGGGSAINPALGILAETTGYGLAKTLTNPNSTLFKVFSEKDPSRLMKIISTIPVQQTATKIIPQQIQAAEDGE